MFPTTIGVIPDPVPTDRAFDRDWAKRYNDILPSMALYAGQIKQASLLFDRLIIPSLEETVRYLADFSGGEPLSADLAWLAEHGLVSPAEPSILEQSYLHPDVSTHIDLEEKERSINYGMSEIACGRMLAGMYEPHFLQAQRFRLLRYNYIARYVAVYLRDIHPEYA